MWINSHTLNEMESHQELEWPWSAIGAIVVGIREVLHGLESQINPTLTQGKRTVCSLELLLLNHWQKGLNKSIALSELDSLSSFFGA